MIDENGTIYQQVPLDVRGRHTIGLDWCAIGIEFVQPAGSGPSQAIAQNFSRPRQLDAGLRLVAWLEATYDIGAPNSSATPWPTTRRCSRICSGGATTTDWNAAAVARFSRRC